MRIISRRRKNVNKTGILMRPDALILEPARTRTTSLSSSPFIPANSFFSRSLPPKTDFIAFRYFTPWIPFAELSTHPHTTTVSTFFPSYVLVHSFYGSRPPGRRKIRRHSFPTKYKSTMMMVVGGK